VRVGIIQSCYIPWRGYFDFIRGVDLFILFDDVQYPQGRSWRNRNRVKTASGAPWLTVPVPRGAHTLAIDRVAIHAADRDWRETHLAVLEEAFRGAPHGADARSLWRDGVADGDGMLSTLNERLTRAICAYLGIDTRIEQARPYGAVGAATDRLISLLGKVGATTYVSGPSARDYLDEAQFRRNGIRLEYKSYDYAPYPQPWGPFVGEVSVLDLIANVGPAARDHLPSRSPNAVAVP